VNAIILSRAPGIYATGLIEENYASKGYHNKAKSCDWGPMAGFVLADARFSKRVRKESGFAAQQGDLIKAFQHGATSVPLFISDFRRMWLIAKGLIHEIAQDDAGDITYRAVGGNVPHFAHNFGFKLLRLAGVPGSPEPVWLVHYRDASNQWLPVEAVVDRDCPGHVRGTYRSATTGDYDLFAVWPSRQSYREFNGVDRRPVDLSALDSFSPFITDPQLQREIRANVNALENPNLGNITHRIEDTVVRLNEAIRRKGYTGGNMVHHSDEGGRPFLTDVDLPVIGFFPNDPQSPYAIENTNDLSRFIQVAHAFQYVTIVNPGWLNQIVTAHRQTGYYR
jgi:hypothetical protein